jgi:hypothetical protein
MESLQGKALFKLMFSTDEQTAIIVRHLLKHVINFNNLTEDCLFLIYMLYHDQDIIKKIPRRFLTENGDCVWDIRIKERERDSDSD